MKRSTHERILTFKDSLTSPHRSHVIDAAQAIALAKYFNDLDELDGLWEPSTFEGKTVERAGKAMDHMDGFADECIQHIICELFNYEGQY